MKIPRMFIYLNVLLLLFISLSWIVNGGSNSLKLTVFAVLFLNVVSSLINSKRILINKSAVISWMSLLIALSLASYFSDSILTSEYFGLVVKLTAALLFVIYLATRNSNIYQLVYYVTSRTCVLSVAIYMASAIFPNILVSLPDSVYVPQNEQVVGYMTALGINYHMITVAQQDGALNLRLQFFYWEPGVYSIVLGISILYAVLNKIYDRWLGLLLLSLFLTSAVGGVLLIIGILVLYYTKFNLSKYFFVLVILGLTLFALQDYLNIIVGGLIELAFDRSLASDSSILDRQSHALLPMLAAFDSPLYGYGLHDRSVYDAMMAETFDKSSIVISNSFSHMAYSFGYIVLIVFVVTFFSRLKGQPALLKLYLLVALAYEPIYLSIFFLVIILVGSQSKFIPSE